MDQTHSPQPANFEFVQCSFLAMRLRGQDAHVVGAAVASLTDQLRRMGWQPDPRDPNQRALRFNGVVLDVGANLSMLASGGVDSTQWYEFCSRAGIAAVPVAVPVAFVPAEKEPRSRTVMMVLAVLLVCAAAIYLFDSGRSSDVDDHLAGHRGIEGQTELPVDGKSNLPGDPASLTYKVQPHEFEVVSTIDPGPERTPPTEGGDWWSLDRWTQTGRDEIGVSYIRQKGDLSDRELRSQWLASLAAEATQQAGVPVKPKAVKSDGRKGYALDYSTTDGWWYRVVRFPVEGGVIRTYCRAMAESNGPDFKNRCLDITATLKINKAA